MIKPTKTLIKAESEINKTCEDLETLGWVKQSKVLEYLENAEGRRGIGY